MDAGMNTNLPCQGIPRRRFICRIPADSAYYRDAIELATTAYDEHDMRHIVRCAFGRLAAEAAIVEEQRV